MDAIFDPLNLFASKKLFVAIKLFLLQYNIIL